jgi:hypothetical protein
LLADVERQFGKLKRKLVVVAVFDKGCYDLADLISRNHGWSLSNKIGWRVSWRVVVLRQQATEKAVGARICSQFPLPAPTSVGKKIIDGIPLTSADEDSMLFDGGVLGDE